MLATPASSHLSSDAARLPVTGSFTKAVFGFKRPPACDGWKNQERDRDGSRLLMARKVKILFFYNQIND